MEVEKGKIIPARARLFIETFTITFDSNLSQQVKRQRHRVLGWVQLDDGRLQALSVAGAVPFVQPGAGCWRGAFVIDASGDATDYGTGARDYGDRPVGFVASLQAHQWLAGEFSRDAGWIRRRWLDRRDAWNAGLAATRARVTAA